MRCADHLKMPAKVRAGDGTFDVFLSRFIAINSSGLGFVGLEELAAYFASLAAANSSNSTGSTDTRVPTATSSGAGLAATTPATPLSKSGSGARRLDKGRSGKVG
jgi:hypothetical protein